MKTPFFEVYYRRIEIRPYIDPRYDDLDQCKKQSFFSKFYWRVQRDWLEDDNGEWYSWTKGLNVPLTNSVPLSDNRTLGVPCRLIMSDLKAFLNNFPVAERSEITLIHLANVSWKTKIYWNIDRLVRNGPIMSAATTIQGSSIILCPNNPAGSYCSTLHNWQIWEHLIIYV